MYRFPCLARAQPDSWSRAWSRAHVQFYGFGPSGLLPAKGAGPSALQLKPCSPQKKVFAQTRATARHGPARGFHSRSRSGGGRRGARPSPITLNHAIVQPTTRHRTARYRTTQVRAARPCTVRHRNTRHRPAHRAPSSTPMYRCTCRVIGNNSNRIPCHYQFSLRN